MFTLKDGFLIDFYKIRVSMEVLNLAEIKNSKIYTAETNNKTML